MRYYSFSALALGLLITFFVARSSCGAQEQADNSDLKRGIFQTPIKTGDLDAKTYSEWVDGNEEKIDSAMDVIWTQDARMRRAYRFEFGKSNAPGIRHMRIGFKHPIAIGAILAGGNIRVSV